MMDRNEITVKVTFQPGPKATCDANKQESKKKSRPSVMEWVWVLSTLAIIPCLILMGCGKVSVTLLYITGAIIVTGSVSFCFLFFHSISRSAKERQERGEKSSYPYLGM